MQLYSGFPVLDRSGAQQYGEWLQRAQRSGGFVLVDKPKGWTSFDVVRFLRRLWGIRKIGHAGTLDPLATGLLILGVNAATRHLSSLQALVKQYQTTIKLGAVTATDDAEAPEQPVGPVPDLTAADLEAVLERFRGTIEQVPPAYSALKYRGQRFYELARRGQLPPASARTVHIWRLELVELRLPFVRLSVACSAGTYIRALARDIGAALGCGAYVYELRRTAIGDFRCEAAWTPQELEQLHQEHTTHARILPT